MGAAALEVWADKVCTAFVPLEVTKLLLCGGMKASSNSYGLKNEQKRLLETETELKKKKKSGQMSSQMEKKGQLSSLSSDSGCASTKPKLPKQRN